METEWKNTYTNIIEQVGDPSWVDWYLNLNDEDPFFLPEVEGEQLFCEDDAIERIDKKMHIRSCRREWLLESSNPYNLDNFYNEYDNTQYNTSDNPSSPFNSTCQEIETNPFCRREWLESDVNPYMVCALILIICY